MWCLLFLDSWYCLSHVCLLIHCHTAVNFVSDVVLEVPIWNQLLLKESRFFRQLISAESAWMSPIFFERGNPYTDLMGSSGQATQLSHQHWRTSRYGWDDQLDRFEIMWQMKADIAACALDQADNSHVLSCFPTGMGKTLPMLLTSVLLPEGKNYWTNCTLIAHDIEAYMCAGSTTIIVAPLRALQAQLKIDCEKAGIDALVGEQVQKRLGRIIYIAFCTSCQKTDDINFQFEPEQFKLEMFKLPRILICSPEFLASNEVDNFSSHITTLFSAKTTILVLPQVRKVMHDCQLAPAGGRPVLFIDECQVMTLLKHWLSSF